MSTDDERRARVALSFLAAPGDLVMGAALRRMSPTEMLAAVAGTTSDGEVVLASQPVGPGLAKAVARWRSRLSEIPTTGRLASWEQRGLRLVVPGDDEWPTQIDDLGDARPLVLWLRGSASLKLASVSSVSMVGSRAASGYGDHVAVEMAATLAEHGYCVVSGGAYGTNSQLARTQ